MTFPLSHRTQPALFFLVVAVWSAASPYRAVAQHADVDFEVADGHLTLPEGNVYSALLVGPGVIPMPAPPPTQADSPGFATVDGMMTPGAKLGLRVVQPLRYWNAAGVVNPSPIDAIFRIETLGGATIDVTRLGIPQPGAFDFATASEEGAIHQHVLFKLPESTSPDGVYGLVLQLTSPGLVESPPFLAVFSQQTSAAELAAGREAILVASGIAEGALAADFNLSDQVDGVDLAAWTSGFGKTSYALLADGDATRDGRVDGADFLAWQRGVGSTAVAFGTHAVPEPAALALAISAGLAGLLYISPRSATGVRWLRRAAAAGPLAVARSPWYP